MRKAIFFFFLSTLAIFGQQDYPQDIFGEPMDIPMILAGTFGELRSNHFHSGIDIKTQQRQGLPILAIADGTITRIKVSLWGYGKVVYVAHPNGYTSVYGHLQKFGPGIEEYIKRAQYEKRSFEVELFPKYGELSVEKGQVIAYSGNTGGSSGPHLHFEIRNSVSEKPTNPLLYGYEVRDATDPVLLRLFGYPLSNTAEINQSQNRIQLNFRKQKDGSFLADPVKAIGTIGFGFIGYDRQDMAANKNGLYAVEQTVNGKVYTLYDFETFSFGESRSINTLIDYEYLGRYGERIQKCFRSPGNRLSIYKSLLNDGKIEIMEGLDYQVVIRLSDFAGNTTVLHIPVTGTRESVKDPLHIERTKDYLIAKKPNNYDLDMAKVYFPANTFYDDFYINLVPGTDKVGIHDNTVPAHRNFTITFDASAYSEVDRDKLFIARLNAYGRPEYTTTYKRGAVFTARTRNLGTYTLAKDTVPPQVGPKNFKDGQSLNNYRYLSVTLSDDLSGIDTYSASLNGHWILMEYEPKTRTLTYDFDDKVSEEKKNDLKITVTDNVGNKTVLLAHFTRK